MKFSVIPARELTPELTARWSAIQQAEPTLANPYFRPEFTQAVAAVRDDVYIGILEDHNEIKGFFPFHRKWGGVAKPVGLGLSDYHGVIAQAESRWGVAELLRGCKLVRWEFDHLLTTQSQWLPYQISTLPSPIINTAQSYQQYEETRLKLDGKQLKETYRKISRLEREKGAHTFVLNSKDPEVFQAMIDWKRKQCQRTGAVDYFGLDWTVELVKIIHQADSEYFGGVLSAVYVGDKLAAVHFGMRSNNVLHSWFPGYDEAFQPYSPGLILLVELIRSCCTNHIQYIDLGRDMVTYKKKFMTDAIPVAQGCVEMPSLLNRARRWRHSFEQWGRQSALRPILLLPGRVIQRIERKGRYS
ncbi:GNAT family N-acetyltransferase [Desulfurivibrio sp. D14AmB]|uniref:GNAT family N-acetyltransferase n=1 Tax=Desulfurivibrio sp. D14AmB TaxID=3374370 RepID=UPI00376EB4D3